MLIGAMFPLACLDAAPPEVVAPVASIVTKRGPIPVQSSMLVSVAYAKRKKILELEFHSGSIYQYLDVPASVF